MEIVDGESGLPAEPSDRDGQLGFAAMWMRTKAIGTRLQIWPGEGSGTLLGLLWQVDS